MITFLRDHINLKLSIASIYGEVHAKLQALAVKLVITIVCAVIFLDPKFWKNCSYFYIRNENNFIFSEKFLLNYTVNLKLLWILAVKYTRSYKHLRSNGKLVLREKRWSPLATWAAFSNNHKTHTTHPILFYYYYCFSV